LNLIGLIVIFTFRSFCGSPPPSTVGAKAQSWTLHTAWWASHPCLPPVYGLESTGQRFHACGAHYSAFGGGGCHKLGAP